MSINNAEKQIDFEVKVTSEAVEELKRIAAEHPDRIVRVAIAGFG